MSSDFLGALDDTDPRDDIPDWMRARCSRCGEVITGCIWGPGHLCIDCHSETLLPPDQWGYDGTPWDDDHPPLSVGMEIQ